MVKFALPRPRPVPAAERPNFANEASLRPPLRRALNLSSRLSMHSALTSYVELEWVGVGAALRVGGDAVVRPARVPPQPLQHEALVPHDDAATKVLPQRRALKEANKAKVELLLAESRRVRQGVI